MGNLIKFAEIFFVRRRWLKTGAVFLLFFSLLLSQLIVRTVEPRWDARDEVYPGFTYVIDAVREGRFPLWDPYTKGGYPFHAEPHQPTLSPVALVLGLTISDTGLGFIFYWLIHWALAGLGMLWLVRILGGTPLGGFVAAVCFSFSGFFIGNAEHTPFMVNAAYLPWILGLADLGISRKKSGYFLLAGFAMGLSSLGGYPAFVGFMGLTLGLWLVLRYSTEWRAVAIALGVVGVCTVLVWLPVLHAFFVEGVGHTERLATLDPHLANFGEPFTFPAFFTLFFPFTTFAARDWMGSDISMSDGYVGILTLPLAVYWWLSETERSKRPWWWLGFFLFMFVLSLGGRAGLRTLLYYIFRLLDTFDIAVFSGSIGYLR